MIDLIARRREMMGASSASAPYRTGSFTIAEESYYYHITHGLNSDKYVVFWKNTNVRTGVNCIMQGWFIYGFLTPYDVYYSNSHRDSMYYISEARSTSSTNFFDSAVDGIPRGGTYSYDILNECDLMARSQAYGFNVGETYEWIAFDINKATIGSEALASSSESITFANAKGTSNVFAMALSNSPTFQANHSIGSFLINGDFVPNGWVNKISFEVRSTWDYSNIFRVSKGSVGDSSITLYGRAGTYPLQAGDYTTYIIKYQ